MVDATGEASHTGYTTLKIVVCRSGMNGNNLFESYEADRFTLARRHGDRGGWRESFHRRPGE